MDNDNISEEEKRSNIVQQAKYAGATFATVGAVDVLAHLGPTGLVVGSLLAFVAYRHGPELVEGVRHYIPTSLSTPVSHDRIPERTTSGERSFWDRALGRFPEPLVIEEQKVEQKTEQERTTRLLDDEKLMYLSPDWSIDVEDAIGKGIMCYGIKGAGKSNFGALLGEQFGQYYIPLVFFDVKPDYLTLIDELPNGYIAGNPAMASKYPAEKFLAVDTGVVDEIGGAILTHGYQVVFDLTSYADDEERARIMTAVVRSLMMFAATVENENRVPCLIFTDEASRWFPQDKSMKSPQMSSETHNALLHQFVEMANQGRSYGIIPCWFDQRPANFDKRLAAQSDIRIFMRQSQDTDIKRCQAIIGHELGAQVADLADGEGIVILPKQRPFMTRFYKRRSKHISNTPRAAMAMERFGTGMSTPKEPVPVYPGRVQTGVMRRHKFTPSTRYPVGTELGQKPAPQKQEGNRVQSTVPSGDHRPLSPAQEADFVRRFKATGSIKESLTQMHISYGRYQRHASQIVGERHLRRA